MLGALLLAAALASGDAGSDAELGAALDLVYAGSTETAVARLGQYAAAAPEDPMPAYLKALALCWKAEERPQERGLDADVHRQADAAIAIADTRLKADPADSRSWLARGGAWGVRSRLHLFRRERGDAIRAAVSMRQDLMRAHALDPADEDALFGLGLYDYYADVLPRLARLLRFLAGYPGGNRARGLARIEEARSGSRWHRTEVEAQLYDIYAFYEDEPDRALGAVRGLRARHPEAPLWGLKLAEHLRDRLGLYAQSAAVAREVAVAADAGAPNHSTAAGTLAHIAEAEALVQDLRFAEARHVLESLRGGAALPRVAALLEQCRAGEVDPLKQALARARRLHEAGNAAEAAVAFAEVLRLAPRNDEARMRVAEHDLDERQLEPAFRRLRELDGQDRLTPPYVRPWTDLLLARVLAASGKDAAAREHYTRVWERPGGLEALRGEAGRALAF